MRIRPKNGLKVRDPRSKRHIPIGYVVKDTDPYWYRRLRSGDVEVVEDEPAPKVEPRKVAEKKPVKGTEK